MNAVDLETQEEAVKRFFLTLPVTSEGSILKLNGHEFARVVRLGQSDTAVANDDGEWTEAKSHRRCELIDRELGGTVLTPVESAELDRLEQHMIRYLDRVAPLPLDYARKLQDELLKKARDATAGDS